MELRQTLKPDLKVSPRLILANTLLQLPSVELEQAIAQELHQNPALEMEERFRCPQCGRWLRGTVCPYCADNASEQPETQIDWGSYTYEYEGRTSDDSEDFDVFSRVATGVSFTESLKLQARLLIPAEYLLLAFHIIESLDEHGYLGYELDEMADSFDVPLAQLEQALEYVQQLDPPGVAARNLRECLLLQLSQLHGEGIGHPWAEGIVSHHLEALARRDYRRIARKLKTTEEEVEQAARFIQDNLLPYPAQAYAGPAWNCPVEGHTYIRPDAVILRNEGNEEYESISGDENPYRVEIWEAERYALRISGFYERLARQARLKESSLSEEEREHVVGSLARARRFLDCLRQRWLTLERIVDYLTEAQGDFLAHGWRALRPLTRAEVADELGLHESTVSRAVANKYALLPGGRIIPLADFFDSSLATKDVIRELIENETEPRSDQAIADKLTAMGYPIARRTVTKYREAMGVLPARLR
jgi:RNA polymerase sigma-54 factor